MIDFGWMTGRLIAATESEDTSLRARGAASRAPRCNRVSGVRISRWGDL